MIMIPGCLEIPGMEAMIPIPVQNLLRFNELEKERSCRRQTIVKQKTSSKLFPGKLKLSMIHYEKRLTHSDEHRAGLIPLKKRYAMEVCLKTTDLVNVNCLNCALCILFCLRKKVGENMNLELLT